jgi:hypothetical protein
MALEERAILAVPSPSDVLHDLLFLLMPTQMLLELGV